MVTNINSIGQKHNRSSEKRSKKSNSLFEDLLTPLPFKREHYKAFLYRPYSRKNRRRTAFYRHEGYDLFVVLEASIDIVSYNERVHEIPIVIGNGIAKYLRPVAFSVDRGGAGTIHTFQAIDYGSECAQEDESCDSTSEGWNAWCRAHSLVHMCWAPKSLRANPVHLENQKRLLRYVAAPDYIPNLVIQSAIANELQLVRKMVWYRVLEGNSQFDVQDIYAALADLILKKKIYSDLTKRQLDRLTEVSVHDAFG